MKSLAIFFLIGLILLQCFDAYSTHVLLNNGAYSELNPIMDNVFQFYGQLEGLILIKGLACIILALFIYRILKQEMKKRQEIYCFVGFGILFCFYFYMMSTYNLKYLLEIL